MRGGYRLWSDADEARLRDAFARGGLKAAYAEFPDKGERGLHRKLTRMGLAGRSQVSRQDAETIGKMWGVIPLREIARSMGRGEGHVLNVIKFRLGLKVAVPPGWEYLTAAAARAGYDAKSFRAVLAYSRVPVCKAANAPGPRSLRAIVETSGVDAAVAAWVGLETLKDAAERHGMFDGRLRKWMTEAGYEPPAPSVRWRLPAAAFDGVVKDRLENFEPFRAAAARLGVSEPTLRRWLADAGVVRRFPRSGLRRSVVDGVAASRRRPSVTSQSNQERAA